MAELAGQCPAGVELSGLSFACPCHEFAARFGTTPPVESCPGRETLAEIQRRHGRDLDAARNASTRALFDLAREIRQAESRGAALEALARPAPTT